MFRLDSAEMKIEVHIQPFTNNEDLTLISAQDEELCARLNIRHAP